MKAPAFQFYAGDYFIDTFLWSNRELGAYTRLLSFEWTNGPLPKDPKKLAKIAIETPENMAKIWHEIGYKFEEIEGNLLVNSRLEETREIQRKYSDLQRQRVEKRWHKNDTTVLPRDIQNRICSPSPSPSPTQKNKEIYKEKKPCKQSLTDEQFFEMLKSNEAYKELNIDIQKAKCEAWCLTNLKMFSRRRFINWLNRAERPIVKMVEESPSLKEYYRKYPEAKNV
jgi:uncharacterized protein YdaU (DUF1376 family)